MIVAGGCYREICVLPHWDRLFGSGGRAAAAISSWNGKVELYAYGFDGWKQDAESSFGSYGIASQIEAIDEEICFTYFHPLSPAQLSPAQPKLWPSLHVQGPAVLRFGFVEGSAVVEAERAVYDPQGLGAKEGFSTNGSRAQTLAIVLNEGEARLMAGLNDPIAAGEHLLGEATVVVLKRGIYGATVLQRAKEPVNIPAYQAARVFKIGSGDIFSAAFAHLWAERRMSPIEAADLASRAASAYVESASLPLPELASLEDRIAVNPPTRPMSVYLAGPFFTTGQLWLVEQLLSAIEGLGVSVFSPFHDVGMQGTASFIAELDLEGLKTSGSMLAIMDGLDPGTLFEIGYARSLKIPVVVLAEHVLPSDLTMLTGTGCEVVDDLSTAVYRAVWAIP